MEANISIFGTIGKDTTSKQVVEEVEFYSSLPEIDAININIISSPGGSLSEGLSIYWALKRSPKKIVAFGSGVVGSASTLIFLGASERLLTEDTDFFIHFPSVEPSLGNAKELKKAADYLEKKGKDVLGIYNKETSLEESFLSELMDLEEVLSAEEALALGFATDILRLKEVVSNYTKKINMSFFKKFTSEFKGAPSPENIVVALESGQMLKIEEQEMKEGAVVSFEDGERVSDGEYKTKEGVSLNIKGGKIEEIISEEVSLKASFETLQNEFNSLKEELSETQKALMILARETTSKGAPPSTFQKGVNNLPSPPEMKFLSMAETMNNIRERNSKK
jgi:ATP-dependent protease ClpP protease subunit